MDFTPFAKIPRLSREMVVTEKIDGTNAQIMIARHATVPEFLTDPTVVASRDENGADGEPIIGSFLAMRVGSRSRWITPGKSSDNHGFAGWELAHAEDLFALGEGCHFGEWWGQGIQRGYGLLEKRFSLFNVGRWYSPADCAGEDVEGRTPAPACCAVVPVLARGPMSTDVVDDCVRLLRERGSYAAPGFMKPEGVIVWHEAARALFKKTVEKDESPKALSRLLEAA